MMRRLLCCGLLLAGAVASSMADTTRADGSGHAPSAGARASAAARARGQRDGGEDPEALELDLLDEGDESEARAHTAAPRESLR